jgi:L-threonylcarbamoyladenylate synthase
MNMNIQEAISVLRDGGIIIFPTDTAYGIGCRIDNESAVDRLFAIRKRPETKATPVLVSSREMVQNWVDEVPEQAEELMRKYWPGGLTIVLNSNTTRVVKLVKGGGNTLGVRMPDHSDLIQIIEGVGIPIIGSSANFAGEKTPFSFEEIDPQLIKSVDFVFPGETSGIKQSSTVVDCTTEPYKILREGAIKLSLNSEF